MMRRPSLRTALMVTGVGAALTATAWQVLGDPAASGAADTATPARARPTAASAAARPLPTRPAPPPRPASDTSPAGGSELLLAGTSASAASAPVPAHGNALATLDTRVVQQRVGPVDAARDAFATRSWTIAPPPPPPPPPEPPPPPPPPPEAPPLPFKYMGKLDESASRTLWYLLHGERLVVAATGEVIDATYRIDGLEAGQLRFTYLPLQKRQSLAIGGSP